MVLKVVTGKILETLELAPGLAALGSVSESGKNGARAKDFALAAVGRNRSGRGPKLRRRSDCQRSVVSV